MKLAIDIPSETYKAISEWDEPNPKYAAEYMLYKFVKNGKRIEQTNCTDAISRSEAIRVASGYCHWTNIPTELAKLPPVTPKPKIGRWKYQKFEGWECMNCGYIVPLYLAPFEYCPKCGCQMIEMMEGVEESETCKDCTNKCIMYEPNMKGCKEVEPQESEE